MDYGTADNTKSYSKLKCSRSIRVKQDPGKLRYCSYEHRSNCSLYVISRFKQVPVSAFFYSINSTGGSTGSFFVLNSARTKAAVNSVVRM